MNHLFAILAAVIHIYIFCLESLFWQTSRVRKIFRQSEADVKITKALAFNQGFYNLFLSIAIILGIAFHESILIHYAMASIFFAGLVLFLSNTKMLRAALIQIVPSLLYFLATFL